MTFLSLTKEFKICMQQYADMLKARCPILFTQPVLFPQGSSSMNSSQNCSYNPQQLCRLNPNQETLVCYLINTGEYCSEVVPQLEQLIKSKMAAPYNAKIDLVSENEIFEDLISLGLKVILGGGMEKLDTAFRTMANTNWSTDTQVGEESAYVIQINKKLSEYVTKIREFLSSTYFNTFCTRLATEILLK